VFYLHIPKTGGQSLTLRLASAFAPNEARFFSEDLRFPEGVETLRSLLGEKKFVESHVAGAVLSKFPELDILATVRDPIDQTISNWRHIRRESRLRLHRAARELSPEKFFDAFASDVIDRQAIYLTSAIIGGNRRDRLGHFDAMMQDLPPALARVRWLVPTEKIDEFVDLWSLETKRNVPNRTQNVNIAQSDSEHVAAARAALTARPHLYAFDRLLHIAAQRRYEEYRRKVFDLVNPWSHPDDSRRAWTDGTGGVWLTENWYDPEVADGPVAWWSGPERQSEVRVKRGRGEKFLNVHVRVVTGISHEKIVFKAKETFANLTVMRAPHPSGHGMNHSVLIDSLGAEDRLAILVPNCLAPIQMTEDNSSLVRRSFLALDWELSDSPRAV
jgi:hypothetical protein